MALDRRAFLVSGIRVAGASALAHPLVGGLLDVVDVGDAEPAALRVGSPPIIRRSQWGADESLKRGSAEFARVTKLIVHHTAIESHEDSEPQGVIRGIYRFHTQSRGWNDIAYNFLVDPAGRVYEGRSARNSEPFGEDSAGRGVVGAHARDHNTGSAGVCLLGNFMDGPPTSAAVEALIAVLAWKADRHGIDPLGRSAFRNGDGAVVVFDNIEGHRDVVPTACPGDHLFALLPSIRRRVALRISEGFIGYRVLATDGAVGHLGGAVDGGGLPAGAGGVDVAARPRSQAYWLLDHLGGVHTRAGAPFYGSVPWLRARGQNIGRARMAAIAPTATGRGYWVADEAGGVFPFGDASFRGSVPLLRLQGNRIGRAAIVDMAGTPTGRGYWVADDDGGVFAFGDAEYLGSVPGLRLRGNAIPRTPITAFAATSNGKGYWVLDAAGGVFNFGNAGFFGSLPGIGLGFRAGKAVDIVPTPDDDGYLILTEDGSVYAFAGAPFYGRLNDRRAAALAPVVRV